MIAAPYPQLRVAADAVDHNIRVMAHWCSTRGVALAPHVKTTMSRPIVERQMAAGAAGVTVATVDQTQIVLGWGHDTVLIANEVVDQFGLTRLREWLTADAELQIRCLVDSPAGIAAASEVFAGAGPDLEVLLDVGTAGGRTGVRRPAEARRLAELVRSARGLRLVGVAGYEGVAPNTRATETLAAVDAHCRRVRDVYLDAADLFETDRPVFSMGGSAFPDRVVEFMPSDRAVPGTIRLLRSGCYVTHDHGSYARVSPLPDLVAALTVRAVVVSAAEDGTVVIGAGKRDLPYDTEPPLLLSAFTAPGERKDGVEGRVQALYDHHTVIVGAVNLSVSDVVELGISHPCSAFDRWPAYLVTDRHGEIIEVWHTDFRRPSCQVTPSPTSQDNQH